MNNVILNESLKNAVASSKMEGLVPTEEDLKLIRKYVSGKITHEEFLNIIKTECQRS